MQSGGTPLSDEILRVGHWRVVIRPGTFEEKRVAALGDLLPILQRCKLSLRGWDFPHLAPGGVERGLDFIGQDSKWESLVEVMRFYQSGQFYHLAPIYNEAKLLTWEEYKEYEKVSRIPVYIMATVFRFVEVFELAARLAMTPAGNEVMRVEVTIGRIEGRALSYGNWPRILLPGSTMARIPEFPQSQTLSREALVSDPRTPAADMTKELFSRFGLDISLESVKMLQDDIRK